MIKLQMKRETFFSSSFSRPLFPI